MKRYLCFFIMIGLLLVLIAPAAAQEAPTPEPVGLRPDAPTYALHGPHWVGTMTFAAQTPSHSTEVTLWYPALNPDGDPEEISYVWNYYPSLSVSGHALQDAAPDTQDGPYPFVVVAHGWEGSRLGYTYLGEHLASEGFVVMAIDFADNSGTTGTIPFYSTLYTRPQDVSWAIDYAERMTSAGGRRGWQGMIDTTRIAVVGHSLGGYTALADAGAQLDFSGLAQRIDEPVLCIEPPELNNMNSCKQLLDQQGDLAKLAGLDTVPDALWPSWGDPRVDAIVALAPKAMPFGTDGVAEVTIPALLMGGSLDRAVSTPLEVSAAYEHLGSANKALVTFEGAGHMIYDWKCSDGPWMSDYGFHWVCSDPVWDMDRANDLVDHFTTAFLLDTLKGDKDAAAALATDAVSFPGVEYQAQGF